MSCLISKETLNDFHDNYIMLSIRTQRMDFYQNCVQRCQEIISIYRPAFPCDCAQLDLLLILIKQHLIDMNKCLVAMEEVVKYMYDHFDEIYKAPKIFISHATTDKPIVEKFVTMLEQMGVKQNQLFCSSIVGYGIPQGAGDLYDFIRNEMSNDNLFVIMMLSQNYYNSPVCLNEMGAAWVKQSAYQSILLPGFQYSKIKGAVNPRAISFNIADTENRKYALTELKDRIIAHLGMDGISPISWERFRDKFIEGVDDIVQKQYKISNIVSEDSDSSKLAKSELPEEKDGFKKCISGLTDFNSNPESINYIGQTLMEIDEFLFEQSTLDAEDEDCAHKLIEEILQEASEDERTKMGVFDPIFNLDKIRKLKAILRKGLK